MKKLYNFLFLILYFFLESVLLFGQPNVKEIVDTSNYDLLRRQNIELSQSQLENQKQIINLNKEILELSKLVAETKQSFYDSKVNTLNLFITITAFIIVIIGIVGYKNISDFKNEIKLEVRDFKNDQTSAFEKYKKSTTEEIRQGLNSDISKAIKNIMKGSFEDDLNSINEQINRLNDRVSNIIRKNNLKDEEMSDKLTPTTIDPITNAFEDEDK